MSSLVPSSSSGCSCGTTMPTTLASAMAASLANTTRLTAVWYSPRKGLAVDSTVAMSKNCDYSSAA
jgi:hypothetical protein